MRGVLASHAYSIAFSDKTLQKRCFAVTQNSGNCFLYSKMSYEFSDGYKIRDQHATHFLTFTVVGWIDIFSRQCYRDVIVDCLKFCINKKGLLVGGWVIMTNHVHFIWTAKHGNLSGVIRDFKTYTSKAILSVINEEQESRREWLLHMFKFYANRTNANDNYKIWTGNNHPEEIFSEQFLIQKLDYLHDNPVRAGLVTAQSHYIYSSAGSYEGKQGLIDIDFLL
jgi:REP element-mobilizing transposase RayT